MKKISLNANKTKFALYKTLKSLSLIIAAIGTIAVFVPFSETIWKWFKFENLFVKIILEILMVFAIFLILGFIIFLIFCLLNKITIKKNKLKITFYKGNIFDDKYLITNDVLLFAGDTDVTLKFDDTSKINKNTIHGQFIGKFSEISVAKDDSFLKELNYKNSKNQKLRAFLIPLTTIKKENNFRAKLERDFLDICKDTIEHIDGSNCKKILMPIIGAGDTSRGKQDYLKDKTHLISLWITLFQIYCSNKKINLTFVVCDDDWKEIRFKELK